MSPRAVDLLEDGFPHGTVEGFAGGCRSAGACPAGHDHGLSCRRAQILSAGNYQYQQLVRAGEEPAIIAQMLRFAREEPAKPSAQKPVEPKRSDVAVPSPPPAPAPAAPKRKWAVRHAWVAFDPDGKMHGPFDGQPAAIEFVGKRLPRSASETPPAKKTRRPWTDAETAQLREFNRLGVSDREISRRLDRSQTLVSYHRRLLGLQATHDRRVPRRPS